MTEFKFWVQDGAQADKALESIETKYNANQAVRKALYREFKKLDSNLYLCEFILPFPDLRPFAWISLVISIVIIAFTSWYWLLAVDLIVFLGAYGTQYLLSPHFLYFALQKGMRKNGYTKNMRRVS